MKNEKKKRNPFIPYLQSMTTARFYNLELPSHIPRFLPKISLKLILNLVLSNLSANIKSLLPIRRYMARPISISSTN